MIAQTHDKSILKSEEVGEMRRLEGLEAGRRGGWEARRLGGREAGKIEGEKVRVTWQWLPVEQE
jgi:hypothetical protein